MTIRLVTRANWRARPRRQASATPFEPIGACVHWEGTGWTWPWGHDTCDDKVRAIQIYHMDTRGWSDIAYNYCCCPHGWVYEGRGLFRRPAANGGTTQNTRWYAVLAMWGTRSGTLGSVLLATIRDAIDYCRTPGGAGPGLAGHRDLKDTDCPGDQLYIWLRLGAPRPGQASRPVLDLSECVYAATHPAPQPGSEDRIALIKATLRTLGCGDDRKDPFRTMWKRWQTKLGYRGKDADGIPGEDSARKLAAAGNYIYRP